MITLCQRCEKKTRQIDASVYAGDYHSPPSDTDYAFGRQCVNCGAIYEVKKIGQTKRTFFQRFAALPPKNQWEEPKS